MGIGLLSPKVGQYASAPPDAACQQVRALRSPRGMSRTGSIHRCGEAAAGEDAGHSEWCLPPSGNARLARCLHYVMSQGRGYPKCISNQQWAGSEKRPELGVGEGRGERPRLGRKFNRNRDLRPGATASHRAKSVTNAYGVFLPRASWGSPNGPIPGSPVAFWVFRNDTPVPCRRNLIAVESDDRKTPFSFFWPPP